jgi:hypothetical protein
MNPEFVRPRADQMSQLTVSEAVKGLLAGITAETELRDESGRVLGLFVPLTGQYARLGTNGDERDQQIRAEMGDRSKWLTTAEAIPFMDKARK